MMQRFYFAYPVALSAGASSHSAGVVAPRRDAPVALLYRKCVFSTEEGSGAAVLAIRVLHLPVTVLRVGRGVAIFHL